MSIAYNEPASKKRKKESYLNARREAEMLTRGVCAGKPKFQRRLYFYGSKEHPCILSRLVLKVEWEG